LVISRRSVHPRAGALALALVACLTLLGSLPRTARADALPIQVTFGPDPSSPTAATTTRWTVPGGVTEVTVTLHGGAGGAGGDFGGGGGSGGTLSANLTVRPGDVYLVTVGGNGAPGPAAAATASGAPGQPGGGVGGAGGSAGGGSSVGGGGGGGGSSTFALLGASAAGPVLVAPGGGGGGGGGGLPLSGGGGGAGAQDGSASLSDQAGGGGAGSDSTSGEAGVSTGHAAPGVPGSAGQGGSLPNGAFGGAGGGGAGAFGGGSGGGGDSGAGGGGGGGFAIASQATAAATGVGASAGEVTIGYTPPPAGPATPRPSIVGTPALGEPLSCDPRMPTAGISVTFAWLRDTQPIPGATASTYVVTRADVTHHLQCRVTAQGITATSAFVSVPSEGVAAAVRPTIVGVARELRRHGPGVLVRVICAAPAPGGCSIAISLGVTLLTRGGHLVGVSARTHRRRPPLERRQITVGAANVRLRAGARRDVAVPLGRIGRGLLTRTKRMQVSVTVQGTVVGAISGNLRDETVTLTR
jgi:hypothetical protein